MSGKAQKVAGGQPKAKAKKLNAASGFLGSQLHTAASTTAVAFPASAYLALSAGAFAPAAPQVHMLGPDGHTHVVPQQAPQPLRTDSSLAAAPTSTSNSITSGDTMHQHAHLAPHTQADRTDTSKPVSLLPYNMALLTSLIHSATQHHTAVKAEDMGSSLAAGLQQVPAASCRPPAAVRRPRKQARPMSCF